MQTVLIIVSGKVQGVWFRQSTKEKALELGITGEVRNRPEGTVKIIATGTEEQLSLFKEWCKQGPPKARVTNLDIKELTLQTFQSFTIERY
ncbi:MAG: acylphosphatase [Chitinophagaceae bacterium]